jgi:hypothetical protein
MHVAANAALCHKFAVSMLHACTAGSTRCK